MTLSHSVSEIAQVLESSRKAEVCPAADGILEIKSGQVLAAFLVCMTSAWNLNSASEHHRLCRLITPLPFNNCNCAK